MVDTGRSIQEMVRVDRNECDRERKTRRGRKERVSEGDTG